MLILGRHAKQGSNTMAVRKLFILTRRVKPLELLISTTRNSLYLRPNTNYIYICGSKACTCPVFQAGQNKHCMLSTDVCTSGWGRIGVTDSWTTAGAVMNFNVTQNPSILSFICSRPHASTNSHTITHSQQHCPLVLFPNLPLALNL